VDDSEGEDEKQTRSHEEREVREEISSQRREEIEAIQRAMDEENERVGSAQPRLSTEEDDRPKRSRGMVNAQHYSVVVKSAYHSKTFSNGKPKNIVSYWIILVGRSPFQPVWLIRPWYEK
jgi:hypothetical protein